MIKRYLVFLVAGFCLVASSLFSTIVHAQDVQNFKFDSFNADYYLRRGSDRSSSLDVSEVLVARFPDFDQNHGILRAIPERYQNHTLSLKILSVTDESDHLLTYSTYRQNSNKVLKIGDATVFVHGVKTYKIHYTMKDVVDLTGGGAQFFWDINGDQWPQNFGIVNANIHIPADLGKQLADNQTCYRGYFGSTKQDCVISRQQQNSEIIITASATEVLPRQTLSMMTSFRPGSFAESQAVKHERAMQRISMAIGAVLAIGLPLVAFIFMFRRWRQFGDDPKGRGIIIPEYEPPTGFNALSADFLMQQKLRPTAVSALLIESAVNGYLTIREIPKEGFFGHKDYQLVLNKATSNLPGEAVQVLAPIFGDVLSAGSSVNLSNLKKDTEIYQRINRVGDSLATSLSKGGFFIKNPKSVKAGYQTWATFILLAAIALGVGAFKTSIWALGGTALGLGLAGLIILGFSFIMPARSEAGVRAHDDLLGLKDYIKLAEAERLRYLQSPEGAEKIQDKEAFNPQTPVAKVKLFEKLLPYAVLFGLEKDWAKQFNDIYTAPPTWYQGNWTAFNAGYLAGSLGDFNSSSAQVFAPPSSSGGGFGGAGGGGGGGGGGGW